MNVWKGLIDLQENSKETTNTSVFIQLFAHIEIMESFFGSINDSVAFVESTAFP